MKRFGKELEFISWIKRDGSGVDKVTEAHIEVMKDEVFKVRRLSISHDTYIASGFNSFVVKLKASISQPITTPSGANSVTNTSDNP